MAKKKSTTKKKTTTATSKRSTARKGGGMPAEPLLVGSKVKAALREHGVNVGEGTVESLNAMMHWYIAQAAMRTQANGRKTTRPHDIIMLEMYRR